MRWHENVCLNPIDAIAGQQQQPLLWKHVCESEVAWKMTVATEPALAAIGQGLLFRYHGNDVQVGLTNHSFVGLWKAMLRTVSE